MTLTEAQLERIQERARGYWNTYVSKLEKEARREAERAEREAQRRRREIRRANTTRRR